MRLIIAAILGGLVMFMWSAFSHMVIGLGDSAYKQVPNESAVIDVMRANITEPGFYFLPGFNTSEQASPEAMAALEAKVKAGPNAILVYDPKGAEIMPPSMLVTELTSNIAAAFVAGVILLFASVGFGRGVVISTLIGLAGWLSINVSYWNWYRFPPEFVVPELIDQLVSWFLAGLVMAFILKKRNY